MVRRIEIMDYRDILEIIAKALSKEETVDIYYPATENSPEGWREIEPYNFSMGTEIISEVLKYGKDDIGPGHILNARTIGFGNNETHSFIIGKIQKARPTGRKSIIN